jgi:hypothetical protein
MLPDGRDAEERCGATGELLVFQAVPQRVSFGTKTVALMKLGHVASRSGPNCEGQQPTISDLHVGRLENENPAEDAV